MIAAAGGRHPVFGTNPIAATFPRERGAPLVIDLSLSEVARGKVMLAAKEGKPIPSRDGRWTDKAVRPRTRMRRLPVRCLPMGGTKGAMLALVVELLACALTGAAFGFEADTFFVDAGNRPRLGRRFRWSIRTRSPGAVSIPRGSNHSIAEMTSDAGVRLPGARRDALAHKAALAGIEISPALAAQLGALAD